MGYCIPEKCWQRCFCAASYISGRQFLMPYSQGEAKSPAPPPPTGADRSRCPMVLRICILPLEMFRGKSSQHRVSQPFLRQIAPPGRQWRISSTRLSVAWVNRPRGAACRAAFPPCALAHRENFQNLWQSQRGCVGVGRGNRAFRVYIGCFSIHSSRLVFSI